METPSKEAEATTTATGSPVVDSTPTDPIEIRELIKKQIEYYFSKENLVHDAFLASQMDAQMSAPISVIMKFGKIKVLTQDENVLKEALESSTAVTVVENRIKSNFKPAGRSTIILRDIASDVPEEEVRSIFAYDGCKPISSIRADIENTWFVIMDSEQDAKDTVLDLKLKKRSFRGESVKCRLKTEAVVKSYFPVSAQGSGATGNYGSGGNYGMSNYGHMDMRMYNGYSGGWNGQQGDGSVSSRDGAPRGPGGSPPKDGLRKDQHKAGGLRDPARKQGPGGQAPRMGKDGARSMQSRDRNGKKGDKNGTWGEGRAGYRAPSFDLAGMNFPPLAVSESATPVPEPGYKEEFTKYTHDEIINVVKNISDVVLPETIEPELHGFAMTDTPNMDLLHRQRTFSIDETREQLRQGKPVQRDAVITGAVDLASMYYGDAAGNLPQPPAAGPATGAPKPGGSWAGILMKSGPPEAPLPPAPPAPKQAAPETAPKAPVADVAVEEKKTEKTAGEKKGKAKDGKSKDGKRRAEGVEGSAEAPVQSSWGGKPSFATILKQQDDAAAAAGGAPAPVMEEPARERTRSGSGPSTPGRKGRVPTDAAPASPATSGWGNRNHKAPASNSKSGNTLESKKENASDGVWVREKLPPAQERA